MQKEYLLDTNAFFNLLRAMNPDSGGQDALVEPIDKLKSEKLAISSITQVEIISVLGKYARGNQGGYQKCNCQISEEGHICSNNRYSQPRPKWNKRKIKLWMKFIDEIMEGRSQLLRVDVEAFNMNTIAEARKIIMHALEFNFASMDAMIAATAKGARDNLHDVTVVTSDKGLKACLKKCGIPFDDPFSIISSQNAG